MRSNFTRIFSFLLLLCILLPLGLSGCNEATPPTSDEDTTVTDEPVTPPTTSEPDYKYVALIGVDGAGAFFADANTPCIDEIFKDGAVTYTMQSEFPSISAQNWGSMLHGIAPEIHGLENSIVDVISYDSKSNYPSIFRILREKYPDMTMASFNLWDSINIGIIEEGIGVYKKTSDTDAHLKDDICSYVKDVTPEFLFVQFDEVDAAGHSNGYGTDIQLKAIERADSYIGEIYKTYEELGILDETLFIVTSDHGGFGQSHGGNEESERNIMFAATGHTVEKNGEISDMMVRDVAAIVLHAFACEIPENFTARIPSGLFEGITAIERPEYVYTDIPRYHANVSTPAADSGKFVTDVISEHKLLAYLPFDGDTADPVQGEITANGEISFAEGYFGESACLDSGSVSTQNIAIDKNGFTVSFWLNIKDASNFTVFSSKDEESGASIFLRIRDEKLGFSFNDGTNRMNSTLNLPEDYNKGWMHVTLTVDCEAQEVRICQDFGKVYSTQMPDAMKDTSIDALKNLTVGQGGGYDPESPSAIDEFMIFDGALTDAEIEKFAGYYGKEPNLFDPIRDYESVPTPTKDSDGYITSFLPDADVKSYLTFDGNAEDSMGAATVTSNGTVNYEDGVFGQSANLSAGYVSLENYSVGKDSFSVSMWVKLTEITGTPVLLSNKDYSLEENPGYMLGLHHVGALVYNFGNGTDHVDYAVTIPKDYQRGWMHVVFVMDREAGKIYLSFDFGEFLTFDIPEELKDTSADALSVLNIGQDGTGSYKNKARATVDEFILFDGALTQDNVTALSSYYGVAENK